MKKIRLLAVLGLLLTFFANGSPGEPTNALADNGLTRQLNGGGITNLSSVGEGVDALQNPEFNTTEVEEGADNGDQGGDHSVVNRSKSNGNGRKHQVLSTPVVQSSGVDGATPGLQFSVNGLNFRQQRLANGGNQFSVEPPDQALCVGNGYVLESVNDVLRVFNTTGAALSPVVDLNTFYNYPAAINRTRTPLAFGPSLTDPICYFDKDVQRWFHVVLTLDRVGTTSALSGKNHLDIAVSTTSSPLDPWKIYTLPVQDDGTDGTPDHGCSADQNMQGQPIGHGPCIGDYPHIGADKYGIYLTTNEYSFFGPEYKSSVVYALSKRALANLVAHPSVTEFQTTVEKLGQPGFTVWPATSPTGDFATGNGGTEFFLSSNAAEEATGVPGGGDSNTIVVWALTNTASLDSSNVNLNFSNQLVYSEIYGIPPRSNQKPGDFPLGQCLNDNSSLFGPGLGCWALFVNTKPPTQTESALDSNDTRMQQVTYAGGLLYGALDTVVKVNGVEKAGIAYFIVKPVVIGNGQHVGPQTDIVKQGYLAVSGNNVTYPAIAVLPNGKGIMGFTLVGDNYYPSAAYTTIDALSGTGSIHVAGMGLGPQDGFTGYGPLLASGRARPRWGDYGAAVADGDKIYFANEYIGQTCTLAQYLSGTIGSCGGTRASFGNWYTRISSVKP